MYVNVFHKNYGYLVKWASSCCGRGHLPEIKASIDHQRCTKIEAAALAQNVAKVSDSEAYKAATRLWLAAMVPDVPIVFVLFFIEYTFYFSLNLPVTRHC